MIFVCPKAGIWYDTYKRLHDAWVATGHGSEEPPFPLILGGWIYSSDRDKQERWSALVRWANEHSLSHLVPQIGPDDQYCTEYLSTSYPEQHYRPDRFVRRERPSSEALDKAMANAGKRLALLEDALNNGTILEKRKKAVKIEDPALDEAKVRVTNANRSYQRMKRRMERTKLQQFADFGVKTNITDEEAKRLGYRVLDSRLVFAGKPNGDVRARIVAKDFKFNSDPEADVYAATGSLTTQRICFATGDVSAAFLHADMDPDDQVISNPPHPVAVPGTKWLLRKALYGLRKANQLLQKHFEALLLSMEFRQLKSDPIST
jgi:hypothetical protein